MDFIDLAEAWGEAAAVLAACAAAAGLWWWWGVAGEWMAPFEESR